MIVNFHDSSNNYGFSILMLSSNYLNSLKRAEYVIIIHNIVAIRKLKSCKLHIKLSHILIFYYF